MDIYIANNIKGNGYKPSIFWSSQNIVHYLAPAGVKPNRCISLTMDYRSTI